VGGSRLLTALRQRSVRELDCSGCKNEGLPATKFRADELVPTLGADPAVKQELKHRDRVLKVYARPASTFTDVEGGEPASVQVSGPYW
jgi:hypothetical protein